MINRQQFSGLRRIMKVLPRHFQWRLGCVLALQMIYGLLEVATILVLSLFVLSLSASEAAQNSPLAQMLFDYMPALKEAAAEPGDLVITTSVLVVIFIGLKNLAAFLSTRLVVRFAEESSFIIYRKALKSYLNQNYYWHLSPAGDAALARLANRDKFAEMLTNLLSVYGFAFCAFILILSLFLAEPGLTLAVMGGVGLVGAILYGAVRNRVDRAGRAVLEAETREKRDRAGLGRGLRDILIYKRQEAFLNSLTRPLADNLPDRIFLMYGRQIPSWILEGAGFASICGVIIFQVVQGQALAQIIQSASMLMLTAWRILPAVYRVMVFSVTVRGLKPQALDYLELLESFGRESKANSLNPTPNPRFRFFQNISLVKASFHYPDGDGPSLQDLSLTIAKGQVVGVIGPSGSGKSTLALLLSGLVSPQSGRFLIDGRPLSPEDLAAYTDRIGYVPQAPLLAPGSLADNVAFSRSGEDYDPEEVAEVCRLATMDFVKTLPKGLDTPLGEDGAGLSSGQAQRVSIARALFARPEVIILDEATNSLDQANENAISETIERLRGAVTTVIIAHRLTTIANCDMVIWLEKGQLKQMGPPETVLPLYQSVMDHNESQSNDARQGQMEAISGQDKPLSRVLSFRR